VGCRKLGSRIGLGDDVNNAVSNCTWHVWQQVDLDSGLLLGRSGDGMGL
jgi:hypothetical protein